MEGISWFHSTDYSVRGTTITLEDDIRVLSNVELFSEFSEEQFRLLAFGSQKLTFPKGTYLFHDGQSTDGGYVIVKGKVELVQQRYDADHVMGTFGAGDLLGEMAIITKNRRTGSAIIVENCELIKISRATVHRILGEYPELAVGLRRRIMESVAAMASNLEAVETRMRQIDDS
ncbi:MAG: cyclic nucleotide-binding domain-containing protein [Pseudomonadota bacterium]